ncbi:MAG: transglutaminase-like putative cysteine protease [Natronomonas sp.]|jgi:transglutaminase-like putative cysteine protease
MMRAILAACCLVGLVLGGALAPAAGIQTPIPDLGVEGEGIDDDDGGIGGDGESAGGPGTNGSSGVSSYGGVSAGGYPERATVGGRLELGDQVALVVESPEPSRWRLGAYANYTGDGWERDTARVPLSSPVSAVGADQPAYEIDVRTRRSFQSLATVNQPAFAATEGRQVFVDQERAFTVDEPIRAGETYTTLTYGEASPASAAVASDGNYPDRIEERYTQLPEDTPDRLGNRTAAITAGAETPYESAVAVERWLETNKDYSLNASHDRDADVATAFVFDMEAGYCQYFATSMVAMLRTQGIPARYVTGYSPGDRVGDDEYRVSEANAHAWVEVYIADVGWVTFDPTPAEGRVEAGRDPASLDELGDDWDTSADDENDTTDSLTRDDETGSSISVTLIEEPVPGRATTAVVTRNGDPVRRADVLFNGERVGGTNRGGSVIGTVPYAETLSIEVRLREDPPQLNQDELDAASAYSTGAQTDGNPVVTFPLPTAAEINTLGETAPGESIEIVATLQGDPIPAADVRVDGERVATTDDRGSATVELPDAETAEIVVERGGISGDRTVFLRSNTSNDDGSGPLSVSVTPEGPAPLPYTPATVRVEYENQPVGNATITVDGDTVAETGADGTATIRLPISDPVTVTAAAPEGYVAESGDDPLGERASAELGGARLTGTVRLGGLYRNATGVLGIGIGLVGGLVGLGRRRDIRARRFLTDRDRLLTEAAQSVLGGVVGIGAAVDSTLPALRRRAERGTALLTDGPEGIAALGAALAGTLRDGLRRIAPRVLLAALRGENPAGRTAGATAQQATIREAWDELQTHTTVPSWATSTPGEIARWAVERDGLPEDAVATLLSAFREVEYGDRPPEERTAAVEAAVERIRETATPTDDGGANP